MARSFARSLVKVRGSPAGEKGVRGCGAGGERCVGGDV